MNFPVIHLAPGAPSLGLCVSRRFRIGVLALAASTLAGVWSPSCRGQVPDLGTALGAPQLQWASPVGDQDSAWLVDTNIFHDGGSSLMASLNVGEPSFLPSFYTTLSGPGTLRFWFRMVGDGALEVVSDLSVYWVASGPADWTQATVYIPGGPHNFEWYFIPYYSSSNTGWVDTVEYQLGGGTVPTLTSQPQDGTVVPGGFADLSIAAAGSPPLSFNWSITGSPPAYIYSDGESSRLETEAFSAGETNVYVCVVANYFGSVTSAPATLRGLGTLADPWIKFTYVPSVDAHELVRGVAGNFSSFTNYMVAAYIYAYYGWWNKPTWANPLTPIASDNSFQFVYISGGIDPSATDIAIFLLPVGTSPPSLGGGSFPSSLFQSAAAWTTIHRVPGLPSLASRSSLAGAIVLTMDGQLPGHRFAIQRCTNLASPLWVTQPGSTNLYGPDVQFEYYPQPGDAKSFFKAVGVP